MGLADKLLKRQRFTPEEVIFGSSLPVPSLPMLPPNLTECPSVLWPVGTAGAYVTGSAVLLHQVSADRWVVGVPGCAADLEQELPQPLKERGRR